VTRPSAVRGVERELAAAGVPDPRTDAELLVGHVLGLPRSAVAGAELSEEDAERLRPLVERRAAREPLQHILGEWGFRRLTLRVDGRALVPRPETEVVVDRALALVAGIAEPRITDVGTGTGAIALALADEHPGARVVAVDASAEAVSLARENAERTGLADRVDVRCGHLLEGLAGPFDLVVSNPPYVRAGELETLEPEVRDYEPRAALLDAGQTEAVARAALGALSQGGALVLEVGDGHAPGVAALLGRLGYADVARTPDLGGTERVVEGRRP
jgi:release factor glutamine methyltransferase